MNGSAVRRLMRFVSLQSLVQPVFPLFLLSAAKEDGANVVKGVGVMGARVPNLLLQHLIGAPQKGLVFLVLGREGCGLFRAVLILEAGD